MEKTTIVKKLLSAVEKNKFEEAESYLTNDFIFSGPVPKAVGKKEWFDLHRKLNKGIPDFSFNAKNINESGNVVNATVQVGGTHSNTIPSLMNGIPEIPPTNKKVLNVEENVVFTFKGDKISKMDVERVPDGGVQGLLKRLGAKVPVQ